MISARTVQSEVCLSEGRYGRSHRHYRLDLRSCDAEPFGLPSEGENEEVRTMDILTATGAGSA